MSRWMTESDVENLFLDILSNMDYSIKFGPDISPGGKEQEREYSDPVLTDRLKERLQLINPDIPFEAIEEAIRTLRKNNSQDLVSNNHDFHNLIVNGVDVQYRKRNSLFSMLLKSKMKTLSCLIDPLSFLY